MNLITEEYRVLNSALHEENEDYGISGHHWRDWARNLSDWGRMTILDYGCGKATLAKSLGPAYRVTNYDPCVPGLDAAPEPHDLVVCGDVMEHVEPECVDSVLSHIRKLAKHKAFFVIGMNPAIKVLADGRNAHLSLHPVKWWHDKLTEHGFTVERFSEDGDTGHNSWFICT